MTGFSTKDAGSSQTLVSPKLSQTIILVVLTFFDLMNANVTLKNQISIK